MDLDPRDGGIDPAYLDQVNRSSEARTLNVNGDSTQLDTDRDHRVKQQLARLDRRDSLGNNSTTRDGAQKISLPEIIAYNQNYN